MKLVPMKDILEIAGKRGIALGAFEFWSFDSAEDAVSAAEELGVPVILQTGALERDFNGGCKRLRVIAETVAADHDVPVALHYDHGVSYEELLEAADAGYTSIMIDASAKPYAENVELTRRIVELSHRYFISNEAELGVMAGNEGAVSRDKERQTRPEEAESFVHETGVDSLAVAIGTAHGLYTFKPQLNIERLKEIKKVVSVPLVLHGGSGTPDDMVRESIRQGIRKVNICTEFVKAFGAAYTAAQAREGFKYSVPSLFGPAKAAGRALAYSKMKLFALK
jgi:ketose-bisphosphate aldolases